MTGSPDPNLAGYPSLCRLPSAGRSWSGCGVLGTVEVQDLWCGNVLQRAQAESSRQEPDSAAPRGAFWGLEKALSMDPEQFIGEIILDIGGPAVRVSRAVRERNACMRSWGTLLM